MRSSISAMCIFCFALGAGSAGASTLDGTWHVVGSVQDNPVNPVCVLAEKDGKLSGTCTGADGKAVPVKGTMTEKEIKWQYDTQYQGGGITLFFTGKIDKDEHLSGAIYVEPYAVDGTFTATKDKAEGAPAPATPQAPPATPRAPGF